jgi:anaphase-promoting complex subunit 8
VACNTHPSGTLGSFTASASVLIHARRAAELLSAISPAKRRARQDLSFVSSTPARNGPADTSLPRVSFATPHPHDPLSDTSHSRVSAEELALELDEEDVLSAGMATFRCREFARAAHTLSACSSARGRFLWLYSQYLVSHRFTLGRHRKLTLNTCKGQRESCAQRLE